MACINCGCELEDHAFASRACPSPEEHESTYYWEEKPITKNSLRINAEEYLYHIDKIDIPTVQKTLKEFLEWLNKNA